MAHEPSGPREHSPDPDGMTSDAEPDDTPNDPEPADPEPDDLPSQAEPQGSGDWDGSGDPGVPGWDEGAP